MSEDVKLLNAYAGERSEAAFTELVRRHLNLVYSAALRMAAGDAHFAQDLTQQVFSELARHANRLSRHPALVGWLYTTTRRMALSAQRARHRRTAREQEANRMTEILRGPEPQPDWDQLRPVLEDAMHQLGEIDRVAVLLRYFQSKSLREVGEALGLSENAARMRVDRALEKVRAQLARKGVTSSASALGVMLAARAVSAAPASLASSVSAAALAGAAAQTTSTFTLLKIMAMTKLKSAAIGAVVVASVATSFVLQQQAQARLRGTDEAVRQQSDQLAQLQSDNQRLSNQLARASAAQPGNPMDNLLALRGEAAALRKQTNELVELLAENQRLRAPPKLESQPSNMLQARELLMSKVNFGKQAMLAFMMHADENGGMVPTNFDQAAKYMGGGVPPGSSVTPDQFDIVYQGSLQDLTNAADVIVIREQQSNPPARPGDKWSKVYAFADGHVEVHSSPDGNFDAWEQQHIIAPK